MKIAILDDYQDAVRQLDCFKLLDGHEVKVFNNSARGAGPAGDPAGAVRGAGADPRTHRLPRALLAKLPNLKLISQTGKVGGPYRCGRRDRARHCDRRRRRLAGRAGRTDLGADHGGQPQDRALRDQPEGRAVADRVGQSGAQRPGHACCAGGRWRSGATARSAGWWPATARRSACGCWCGAARRAGRRRWPTASRRRRRARRSSSRPTC